MRTVWTSSILALDQVESRKKTHEEDSYLHHKPVEICWCKHYACLLDFLCTF